MNLSAPQDFILDITGDKYTISNQGGPCGFSRPASLKNTPKLYATYDDQALHYIGITRQSMSSRLLYGIKASGKNGYHGYKWKHLPRLYLSIWTVIDCKDDDAYKTLETIEAEAVFLYRKRHKRWPESQHEIHFHNNQNVDWRLPTGIIDHIEGKLGGAKRE